MNDSHRAVCCVDALASSSSRSEGVDSKILRLYMNVELQTTDSLLTRADKHMEIIKQKTSVTSFGCGKTMTVMVPVWIRCILEDRPTSGILCTLCVPPSCFRCLYTLSPAILTAAWCSPPEGRQIMRRPSNLYHKFTQKAKRFELKNINRLVKNSSF